jgi:hypothetical protein
MFLIQLQLHLDEHFIIVETREQAEKAIEQIFSEEVDVHKICVKGPILFNPVIQPNFLSKTYEKIVFTRTEKQEKEKLEKIEKARVEREKELDKRIGQKNWTKELDKRIGITGDEKTSNDVLSP